MSHYWYTALLKELIPSEYIPPSTWDDWWEKGEEGIRLIRNPSHPAVRSPLLHLAVFSVTEKIHINLQI